MPGIVHGYEARIRPVLVGPRDTFIPKASACAGDRLLLSEGQVSEQAQEFLLCHICHTAGEPLE